MPRLHSSGRDRRSLFHGLFNLPGDDALDRSIGAFFKNTLLVKEVFKRRPDMRVFYVSSQPFAHGPGHC